MIKQIIYIYIFIPILVLSATFESPDKSKPPLQAIRLDQIVTIDGVLDENVWHEERGYESFTMRDPLEGKDPSEKTIVKLAYDDAALYIAARMYDSSPDSIVSRLGRRDQPLEADNVTFYIDPYYDKRSGYYFGINAGGTFYDGTLYNDDGRDHNWDGIWEGRVHTDNQGWTVEMRIPFSQLRFKNSEHTQWAVNFARHIERKKENSYIVYTPKNESGFVSRFVDLKGIEQIKSRNSLEIMPYFRTKADYTHPSVGDPFSDGSRYVPGSGMDMKYRIGGNLVVDMTVNPDFGQVEVDPAVVNLSAYETFFPEKRPFFIEGSSIFSFGHGGTLSNWGFSWDNPNFFYSRRIGRSPQREMPDYSYADIPDNSKILGAAKLTGKLGNNWNFGSINALTSREYADFDANGTRSHLEVEPQTYYGILRAQKEVDNGRQGIGFLTTAVNRQFSDELLRNDVNSESYAFGVDGWTFLESSRTWVLTGWFGGSHIRGSRERMIDVQTSSRHYFQRPDAKAFSLDSTATSMTGTAGRLLLNKQKGNVIFNTAIGYVSPSFEVNDLGFMRTTNEINGHVGGGYKWTEPRKLYRSIHLIGALYYAKDFDGSVTDKGVWQQGSFTFTNYYSLRYTVSYEAKTMESIMTRGGPGFTSPPHWSENIWFSSDSRKPVIYGMDFSQRGGGNGDWFYSVGAYLSWKPMPNFSLSFEPDMDWEYNSDQWIDMFDDATAVDTYRKRYVYSGIRRKEFSAGFRMNWTFTPRLSLQLFAQPLVSTGEYSGFKEFTDPGGYGFHTFDTDNVHYNAGSNHYTIDPDGAGPAGPFGFDNPDFDYKSLRGNAVLRWEYLPGSTLYLVWTQQRSDDEYLGDMRFERSLRRMWSSRADNIFMMKISYWLSI